MQSDATARDMLKLLGRVLEPTEKRVECEPIHGMNALFIQASKRIRGTVVDGRPGLIGIHGPRGSGKSTALKLFAPTQNRFLDEVSYGVYWRRYGPEYVERVDDALFGIVKCDSSDCKAAEFPLRLLHCLLARHSIPFSQFSEEWKGLFKDSRLTLERAVELLAEIRQIRGETNKDLVVAIDDLCRYEDAESLLVDISRIMRAPQSFRAVQFIFSFVDPMPAFSYSNNNNSENVPLHLMNIPPLLEFVDPVFDQVPERQRKRLDFLRLRSDCIGHPQLIHFLNAAVRGLKRGFDYHSGRDYILDRLKKTNQLMNADILRAVVLQKPVKFSDQFEIRAGKQASAVDLLKRGIFLNSLTSLEIAEGRFVPYTSPFHLQAAARTWQYHGASSAEFQMMKAIKEMFRFYEEDITGGYAFERYHAGWEVLFRVCLGKIPINLNRMYGRQTMKSVWVENGSCTRLNVFDGGYRLAMHHNLIDGTAMNFFEMWQTGFDFMTVVYPSEKPNNDPSTANQTEENGVGVKSLDKAESDRDIVRRADSLESRHFLDRIRNVGISGHIPTLEDGLTEKPSVQNKIYTDIRSAPLFHSSHRKEIEANNKQPIGLFFECKLLSSSITLGLRQILRKLRLLDGETEGGTDFLI